MSSRSYRGQSFGYEYSIPSSSDSGISESNKIPVFQRNRKAMHCLHFNKLSTESPEVVLEIELPGVQKENIAVKVEKRVLTIDAMRPIIYQPNPEKNYKLLREDKMEDVPKDVGNYHLSITLHHLIDENEICYKGFENGLLTITAPFEKCGVTYEL